MHRPRGAAWARFDWWKREHRPEPGCGASDARARTPPATKTGCEKADAVGISASTASSGKAFIIDAMGCNEFEIGYSWQGATNLHLSAKEGESVASNIYFRRNPRGRF
jgi:hypothetical protein